MQLCDELHLLVHQSSHAQLAKLEQLTLQLEELEAASMMSHKQSEDSELQQGLHPKYTGVLLRWLLIWP